MEQDQRHVCALADESKGSSECQVGQWFDQVALENFRSATGPWAARLSQTRSACFLAPIVKCQHSRGGGMPGCALHGSHGAEQGQAERSTELPSGRCRTSARLRCPRHHSAQCRHCWLTTRCLLAPSAPLCGLSSARRGPRCSVTLCHTVGPRCPMI